MTIADTSRPRFNVRLLRAVLHPARDQRGQSLVETALSMMVMLMLIFGIIEGCWAVYSFHYLANAAHEAARYAIVRGGGWGVNRDNVGGWSASMCTASPGNIASFAANRGFPGINIDPNNDVCVNYFSSVAASRSSICNKNASSSFNRLGDIVEVTIAHPFTLTLPGLPAYTWNLTSTSQMVIAQ